MSIFRCLIQIRETATGNVVEMSDQWDDDGSSHFNWSENNYSCDCNRRIFFFRGMDFDSPGCSDGAYRVRITRADDGSTLYDEWATP